MISIAIDGPSGAGKSVLAKNISKALGYIYVDTGAMYRAIGLYVFRSGVSSNDVESVVKCLENISLDIRYEEGTQVVYLNGENVNTDIRLPEISMYASAVSAIPAVRSFLLDLQRDMAKNHNVVMDGRDIGTVVLPNADVKIFLFANEEERAKRRYAELTEKGQKVTFEEVYGDMKTRDANDKNRTVAPAVPADDAIMFDNTGYEVDETLEKALKIISEKLI